MAVLPLAQSELCASPSLLEQLFEQGPDVVTSSLSATTRQQYVHRITVGGFPDALARSSAARRSRWFDDYVQASLAKDVADLKRLCQAQALPSVLKALGGNTGQVLNRRRVAQSLSLKHDLVTEYTRLLEAVFLIRIVPAWSKTITPRSAANPKVHVVDSGVAARLLRMSEVKLRAADATVLTEFGHLAETFVVGEVLKEVSWLDGISSAGHWRTYDAEEVDLVVERDDGMVIAMEIKAGTHASKSAFQSLARP